MGNRLRELRGERSLTQDEAAQRMRISRSQYIKLERGERRLTSDYIARAAQAFGVSPAQVLVEQDGVHVPVVGKVGADPTGAIAFGTGQGLGLWTPPPPGGAERTVALLVEGHSQRGLADDGSLVYYDMRRDPPTDDMVGHVVVVGLPTGEVLLKRLLRGSRPHLFDLESLNGPTLRDAEVEWAAHITAIVPPWQARKVLRADA